MTERRSTMKSKRILACIVAATTLFTGTMSSGFVTSAEENTEQSYTYDDYDVLYQVTNLWGDTEVVSITLTNTGEDAIENWMLYFDPNKDVTSVTNVQQMTTSDGITYYKNSGYNADVDVDSSVTFTYFVDNCTAVPDSFTLCQTREEKESGYEVSLQVNETWGTSFNGAITIQNNTDTDIEGWELTVDTNFTITEITNSWAATVTELEPYSYLLKGTYTGTVYANSSVSLGFVGVMDGEPEITDYSLTEIVVDEDVINAILNDNDEEFYDDCIDWSTLPDLDEDGLPDEYEEEYGCDPDNPDSDGDGLPDGYEILTVGSDPADANSLDANLNDGEYDNDQDGLTNYEEYVLGTDPLVADSDFDGLSDGDETDVYGTDPLNADTDGDGLSDGDKVALGLDPLSTDTDGDSITDNEEVFSQSRTFDGDEEDSLVKSIDVAFEGTGYVYSNTKVKSVMDIDWMCSNVVGLIGDPYDISSTSSVNTGSIIFHVDQSSLGDTSFDNLAILWYDEENQRFEEMETVLDVENSTVSTTVSHFSKYLIVDCTRWYAAWSENYYPSNGTTLHTAITIDCSSSMETNDPNCYRIAAANSFVDVMIAADLASIIFFADGAEEKQELTDDEEALKAAIEEVFSAGTTNYDDALTIAIESLEKQSDSNADNIIIFLSDGRPTYLENGTGKEISAADFDYSLVDEAASKGIRIYTIGLTDNVNEEILKKMASRTNGEYFYANTADELVEYFLSINMEEKYDTTTDTDWDGLPDLFEECGMPVANGQILFSDPNAADTDGDGLLDGEEVLVNVVNDEEDVERAYNFMRESIPDIYISNNGGIYFEMIANLEKISTSDDGINDFDKLNLEKIFDKYKSEYYSQDCAYYDFYDDEEYYYEHLDERFKERNALKKYTVESLFPEFDDDSLNSSSNSTYIIVDGNNIEIHVNLMLWDAQYIEDEPLNGSDYNYNQLASQMLKNIDDNDTRTLREAFVDGLKYYWEDSLTGSLFNFYPGMEINTSIVVHDFTGTDTYYDNGINHKSRMYVVLHSEEGRSYMTVNEINIFCDRDILDFYRSSSHEFGHILGLADYYSDAGNEIPLINDVQLNPEIRKNGLMNCAYANLVELTPNDIEMAIYGSFDDSFSVSQFYIPSRENEISTALREKIMYSKNYTSYKWVEDGYFIPATSDIENNGLFEYYLYNDNITITGLDEELKYAENIDVPSEIDGYPVKFINAISFEGCSNLASI